MREKIESRINELSAERDRVQHQLQIQAQQQIAQQLQPYEAAIAELKALLEPEAKEETTEANNDG